MSKIASAGAGIICTAVAFASLATADPSQGHFVNVRTRHHRCVARSARMIPTELVPMSFARRSVSRRRRRTPCLTRVGREIDRISTDSKIASAGRVAVAVI